MKQLDIVVSPLACVWDPYRFFSSNFGLVIEGQTDRNEHRWAKKSDLCSTNGRNIGRDGGTLSD